MDNKSYKLGSIVEFKVSGKATAIRVTGIKDGEVTGHLVESHKDRYTVLDCQITRVLQYEAKGDPLGAARARTQAFQGAKPATPPPSVLPDGPKGITLAQIQGRRPPRPKYPTNATASVIKWNATPERVAQVIAQLHELGLIDNEITREYDDKHGSPVWYIP